LRYKYDWCQGFPWAQIPFLKKEGNKLFQQLVIEDQLNWEEIAFFHFRHSKVWPL
jgi:hypothetical protein